MNTETMTVDELAYAAIEETQFTRSERADAITELVRRAEAISYRKGRGDQREDTRNGF